MHLLHHHSAAFNAGALHHRHIRWFHHGTLHPRTGGPVRYHIRLAWYGTLQTGHGSIPQDQITILLTNAYILTIMDFAYLRPPKRANELCHPGSALLTQTAT